MSQNIKERKMNSAKEKEILKEIKELKKIVEDLREKLILPKKENEIIENKFTEGKVYVV